MSTSLSEPVARCRNHPAGPVHVPSPWLPTLPRRQERIQRIKDRIPLQCSRGPLNGRVDQLDGRMRRPSGLRWATDRSRQSTRTNAPSSSDAASFTAAVSSQPCVGLRIDLLLRGQIHPTTARNVNSRPTSPSPPSASSSRYAISPNRPSSMCVLRPGSSHPPASHAESCSQSDLRSVRSRFRTPLDACTVCLWVTGARVHRGPSGHMCTGRIQQRTMTTPLSKSPLTVKAFVPPPPFNSICAFFTLLTPVTLQ